MLVVLQVMLLVHNNIIALLCTVFNDNSKYFYININILLI